MSNITSPKSKQQSDGILHSPTGTPTKNTIFTLAVYGRTTPGISAAGKWVYILPWETAWWSQLARWARTWRDTWIIWMRRRARLCLGLLCRLGTWGKGERRYLVEVLQEWVEELPWPNDPMLVAWLIKPGWSWNSTLRTNIIRQCEEHNLL